MPAEAAALRRIVLGWPRRGSPFVSVSYFAATPQSPLPNLCGFPNLGHIQRHALKK
jgi:hypothetical protein